MREDIGVAVEESLGFEPLLSQKLPEETIDGDLSLNSSKPSSSSLIKVKAVSSTQREEASDIGGEPLWDVAKNGMSLNNLAEGSPASSNVSGCSNNDEVEINVDVESNEQGISNAYKFKVSDKDIKVGKLVKKQRHESGTSDEELSQSPLKAPCKKRRRNYASRKESHEVVCDREKNEESNTKQVNATKNRKKTVAQKPKTNRQRTNRANKLEKRIDSSDSSDSEDSSRKRRSGVKAVRGLAALKMAYMKDEQSLNRLSRASMGNTVREEDSDVNMVEGTPYVGGSARLGRILKSQLKDTVAPSLNGTELGKAVPTSSTENETQSQEIISDTPTERNSKRISPRTTPRKQVENDVKVCDPSSPNTFEKFESTLQAQEHSDEEMFDELHDNGSVPSDQATSTQPESESLLQPNPVREAITENQLGAKLVDKSCSGADSATGKNVFIWNKKSANFNC